MTTLHGTLVYGPSEFMPCRSAQHTPTWGRHIGCWEWVAPCTTHTRVSPADPSADEQRTTPTGSTRAWGPGTCVSTLRVQGRVYSTHMTYSYTIHYTYHTCTPIVLQNNNNNKRPPPPPPLYCRISYDRPFWRRMCVWRRNYNDIHKIN